ncbi:hypothetical protein Taro_032278 [Colocasia esculenta]|uniref:Aminotransferase-like plant mobile domain-containing protein n=1 Tax=Colocasia esculenta TaxID=4460 RepID=A0A843W3G2_COLES|nr:hypothetical protein [Colocasia esculenta]
MNEAGPSHNVNENLELHDAPVINDEVLENSESDGDGDDDNDNIQSSSDDDAWRENITCFYMHKNNIDLMIQMLHVAGPIPRPPLNPQDVSFGARWHRRLSRETPNRTWEFYRNEFDVIEESQIIWEPYALEDLSRVGAICRENSQLWRAHVPMFCMGVMEVHMPERVWRQFGAPQVIPPTPERYDRKDGRGHARENWLLYHARYIERWNDRANAILKPPTQEEEDQSQWRQWYGQQSNLYLTPFSEEPPTEYCPRGPIERALVDVTFRTRELLITNPEASYLDVKNDILKLQEDTLNKLRIKDSRI